MAMPELALYQICLVWDVTGVDRYGKETVAATPREVECRWEQKRRQWQGPDGTFVTLEASLHTEEKLGIGSHVWLGELDEWYGTGSGSAMPDQEVHVVSPFVSETPDLFNVYVHYKYGLRRLHNV